MKKYTAKNSINARVASAQVYETTPVPPGIKIISKDAKELWKFYTDSRIEWADHHLLTVAKVVQLELRIRTENMKMATEDIVIETRLGEIKENPRLAAIDRLVKQQSSLMRLVGLNVNNDDAGSLNRSPKGGSAGIVTPDQKSEDRKALRAKLVPMRGGKAG